MTISRKENGSSRLSSDLGEVSRQRLQPTPDSPWVRLPGSNREKTTISISMLDVWKRQSSPSHVGCRYQLTVGKARLGSRMVDALRYSRFLLFFSFYGNIQTLNDFIQRSSFFCKGQGPRPVDWQLFQEVRDTQAVGRFPLFLGLVPVAGGSSLASGATSMG